MFYEAYSLKPIRKVKVLFNVLPKSSVIYILRRNIHALVTINNV